MRTRMTLGGVWDTANNQQYIARRSDCFSSPEWSSIANLYDRFKVNSMRVRVFYPRYRRDQTYTAGGIPSTSVASYPLLAIFAYDNDQNTGFPSTIGIVSEYGTAGMFSPAGEVSYTVDLPTAQLSPAVGVSVVTSEWCDVAYPTSLSGAVFMTHDQVLVYGLGSTTSFSMVPVIVEYDVTFEGRR